MSLFKWDGVHAEQLSDHITRRYISGDKITLAKFFLKKGAFVPPHSHENEQFSTVMTGAAKFVLDGEESIVSAGETFVIPPFTLHSAEALEDTEVLDVFSPTRTDWEAGQDDYLRGKVES